MKDKQKYINQLLEEAQANLILYTKGQDDYAYHRYKQIMEHVRTFNSQ